MLYKAPRGTHDVLPSESYKWQYVENAIRTVCRSFGYKEVRVPVFEHTDVFERGIGDTTDVVQKEMYTFLDKGDRSITLRPEGTAGVVRCFLEHSLYAEAQPIKMYYMMSCYRYEKPQAGRLREFHQFGIESFGSPSPANDAEVISLAVNLLKSLKMQDLKLLINSIGCKECRKVYNTQLIEYFNGHVEELCGTCNTRLEKNPMRIMDCKAPVCKEIGEKAPKILYSQCERCGAHFEKLKQYLDGMGIEYGIDDTIVRGLDYYTTTVFELKSCGMTICGGGRYNDLVEEFGGTASPGVGFGMGLERVIMSLEQQGVLPKDENELTVYVANIGEAADMAAQTLVNDLRLNGIAAEKDLVGRSFKAQMKYADKAGARFVIVLGDDEIASGKAQLKDMKTGKKVEIQLAETARQILNVKE